MLTIIKGVIASQPAVVSMENYAAAFVLIKTKEGYQKCYCRVERTRRVYTSDMTMFSDVMVSSIGDEVLVEVFVSPAGQVDGKIKNFRNDTKDLGYI